MGGSDPGSAREEAERLVAAALAAARLAASGRSGGQAGQWGPLGGMIAGVLGHTGESWPAGPAPTGPVGGFATGTPECCVCPVCRTIAVLREPSPEVAERVATGAGDFAAGLVSLLRALSGAVPPAGTAPSDSRPAPDDDGRPGAARTGVDSRSGAEWDVWAAATRTDDGASPGDAEVTVARKAAEAAEAPAAKPAAKKAVKKVAKKAVKKAATKAVGQAAVPPVVSAPRAPAEVVSVEDDASGNEA